MSNDIHAFIHGDGPSVQVSLSDGRTAGFPLDPDSEPHRSAWIEARVWARRAGATSIEIRKPEIEAGSPPPQALLDLHYPDMTVGRLAERLYGHLPAYDTALPQPWVNACLEDGFDPRGSFVWVYPVGSLMGQPGPLTAEAAREIPAACI